MLRVTFEHGIRFTDRWLETRRRIAVALRFVPKLVKHLCVACHNFPLRTHHVVEVYFWFECFGQEVVPQYIHIWQTLKSRVHVACVAQIYQALLPLRRHRVNRFKVELVDIHSVEIFASALMVVLIWLTAILRAVVRLAARALHFQHFLVEAVLALAQHRVAPIVLKDKPWLWLILCIGSDFNHHYFDAIEWIWCLLEIFNLGLRKKVDLQPREFDATVCFNHTRLLLVKTLRINGLRLGFWRKLNRIWISQLVLAQKIDKVWCLLMREVRFPESNITWIAFKAFIG